MVKGKPKKLIAIVGPTASGKTTLAIQLAQKFNTEIISADSRQFFKELSIGTAKPNHQELTHATHHFIGHKSIKEEYSAGEFEKDALKRLETIYKTNNVAVLVGGSGLYINALLYGLDSFPEISTVTKDKWRNASLEELQNAIKKLDATYAQTVDISNKQRLTRALEVIEESGQPYSTFLTQKTTNRSFDVIKLGINWPREKLYERINQRVDLMLEKGLENEVNSLHSLQHLNALNTVGYKELFAHYNGEFTKQEAIRLIKRNTRRYAKRQLTWFRKDNEIQWIKSQNINTFITKFSL